MNHKPQSIYLFVQLGHFHSEQLCLIQAVGGLSRPKHEQIIPSEGPLISKSCAVIFSRMSQNQASRTLTIQASPWTSEVGPLLRPSTVSFSARQEHQCTTHCSRDPQKRELMKSRREQRQKLFGKKENNNFRMSIWSHEPHLVENNNWWFVVALFYLLVSPFQQISAFTASTNVRFSLGTHDGIQTAVAAWTMETLPIIMECRIRKFLCKRK